MQWKHPPHLATSRHSNFLFFLSSLFVSNVSRSLIVPVSTARICSALVSTDIAVRSFYTRPSFSISHVMDLCGRKLLNTPQCRADMHKYGDDDVIDHRSSLGMLSASASSSPDNLALRAALNQRAMDIKT